MGIEQETKQIVITGIGGRFGRLVAQRLHRLGEYEVVGIDRRRISGLPKDVRHLQVDLRSKRAQDVFRTGRVAAAVHVGLRHNPRAVDHGSSVVGTQRLLECCREYKVPKVIVLSSADVYGPRPDNQQFLTEEAPLLGAIQFPEIHDLVEVDMLTTSFFWRAERSGIRIVILRPVHILGSVHNAASNYLRFNRIPVLMGFDPMIQVIHELDVVEAIVLALKPKLHGVFNITGPTEVPLSVVIRETGKPVLPLPPAVFKLAMQAAWKLRLSSFPAPELEQLRFVAMVDGSRARKTLGFRPRYSLREAVRAVDGVEVERRAALDA